MKSFSKAVQIGTKVMISGEYSYRVVKSVHPSRQWVEVEGIAGQHQVGHIVQYTNKSNVEMYPAIDDLYVSDAYGSVYERREDANYFIGKLNGQTLKQFVSEL